MRVLGWVIGLGLGIGVIVGAVALSGASTSQIAGETTTSGGATTTIAPTTTAPADVDYVAIAAFDSADSLIASLIPSLEAANGAWESGEATYADTEASFLVSASTSEELVRLVSTKGFALRDLTTSAGSLDELVGSLPDALAAPDDGAVRRSAMKVVRIAYLDLARESAELRRGFGEQCSASIVTVAVTVALIGDVATVTEYDAWVDNRPPMRDLADLEDSLDGAQSLLDLAVELGPSEVMMSVINPLRGMTSSNRDMIRGIRLGEIELANRSVERYNSAFEDLPDELPWIPCQSLAGGLGEADLAALLPCTQSIDPLTSCSVTGTIPFIHPEWGAVTLATWGPRDPYRSVDVGILVVNSKGQVLWRRTFGDVGMYMLQPAGLQDRLYDENPPGVDAPVDALGHIFLEYNPGRYNGVIVLQPIDGGFNDFGSLPPIDGGFNPENYYSGSYYYAEVVDIEGDGEYEIQKYYNDCNPGCAYATITSVLFRWDGSGYSE